MSNETTNKYPRSIGEIVRGQKDAVHNNGCDNIFESLQITNTLTLTVIESYFKGMVGETICAYSYYVCDFSLDKPTLTPVDTEDDLRKLYNLTRGRTNRFKIWYFLKNFRGWSEDPRPYVI